MAKKVKSAKGEVVDFDLMKVKAQIGDTPKPVKVKAREEFIERKMRRRLKKAKVAVSNKVESDKVEEAPTKEAPVEEAPKKAAPKRKINKKKNT